MTEYHLPSEDRLLLLLLSDNPTRASATYLGAPVAAGSVCNVSRAQPSAHPHLSISMLDNSIGAMKIV